MWTSCTRECYTDSESRLHWRRIDAAFFTGADLASIQNIIKNNNIAVASHSASGINIENNLMDSNALAGVTFVNTDESAVSSNKIQGSQNGIFFDSPSTGNTAKLNDLLDNVVDLNNANGLAPTVNKNSFLDNDCSYICRI